MENLNLIVKMEIQKVIIVIAVVIIMIIIMNRNIIIIMIIIMMIKIIVIRGCSYGSELGRLGGLAHLDEISPSLRNSFKKLSVFV